MLGSVLIVGLLCAVGAMVHRSIATLIEDTKWVNHTHSVLESLAQTSALLRKAENNQRCYIITGQELYLSDYHQALPRLEDALLKTKQLASDNPRQLDRLKLLESHMRRRLAFLKATLRLRQQQGFAAAQRRILTGEGKREMDSIEALIKAMSDEETRLLAERSQTVQDSARLAIWIGSGGLAVSMLITLAILDLVRRETTRRMRVEAGLAATNTRLQETLTGMQRLTREMTLLASTAEMLQTCRTPVEAYAIIERALRQMLPEASSSLGIINASQNLVEVVLQTASEEESAATLFAPDECWALRRGRIHLARDAQHDLRCPHLMSSDQEISDKAVLGTALCLPLIAQGETLGVLSLCTAPGAALPESDQRAAHALGEHISLALANLKLQEMLRTQSIRDPLSGLFNRRYLEVSFERELARAQRRHSALSVVMIDIDFFKKFNDTYGHEAGDLLLREFGEFLRGHCRGEDIACRYGGEEFTLLLPEAPLEAALQRAEQLRLDVSRLRLEYRRQPLPGISFSAGVASYPGHGENKEDLLRSADAALYRAKKAGRNRVEVAVAP
jgi:diguanylate cyclase (GGDEF)-like protein